jgi:hypothetical protein
MTYMGLLGLCVIPAGQARHNMVWARFSIALPAAVG